VSTASVGSELPWRTGREASQSSLELVLIDRTYVLPWTQFLYAEGSDDEVRLVFATHDVLVRGAGLQVLLADLAAHRLVGLNEPLRAELFTARTAMCVRELVVTKAES
jgi:hypothetical protein